MLAIEIPQYEYKSGAIAKHTAFALDMHYGSELFTQRKNGPAVAIVGAISTISAGMAIPGILGGIMIAGGIASGIGALTGNKTLSTLGMGLGLVGGLGSAFATYDTVSKTTSFANPFSDGYKFSNTIMGEKIQGFLKEVSTPTTQSAGDPIIAKAGGNAQTAGITSATNDTGMSLAGGNTSMADGVSRFGGGNPVGNPLSNAVGGSGGGGSSGGLLSSLGGAKDVLALAGGLSDGYMRGQQIEQQQPLIDARKDQINAETQLAQNRYNNMQAQPSVNIGVNDNANIYKQNTSTGKVAVIVDGKVQYMTPEQYAQIMQAQQQAQQQAQNQTGLLGAA